MMTNAYRGKIAGRPLATRCKILVAIAKFSVALATRKAQFRTLDVRCERADCNNLLLITCICKVERNHIPHSLPTNLICFSGQKMSQKGLQWKRMLKETNRGKREWEKNGNRKKSLKKHSGPEVHNTRTVHLWQWSCKLCLLRKIYF